MQQVGDWLAKLGLAEYAKCFAESLTFQADTEDVQSRVDVSIVRRAVVRTDPVPYSKRAHTFRTTAGNAPAARARPGSPSLVDFHIPSPVPAGLVAELIAERRPPRVEHGLGHPCLRELGSHEQSARTGAAHIGRKRNVLRWSELPPSKAGRLLSADTSFAVAITLQ